MKLVIATPNPTDPVEISTSSISLVLEGYDCAPPKPLKFSIFSLVCNPDKY